MSSLKESLTLWTISILRVRFVKNILRRNVRQVLTNNSPSIFLQVDNLFQSKFEKFHRSR